MDLSKGIIQTSRGRLQNDRVIPPVGEALPEGADPWEHPCVQTGCTDRWHAHHHHPGRKGFNAGEINGMPCFCPGRVGSILPGTKLHGTYKKGKQKGKRNVRNERPGY